MESHLQGRSFDRLGGGMSPAELLRAGGYGDKRQLLPGLEIEMRAPPVLLSLRNLEAYLTLGYRNGCRGRRR